MTSHQPTRHRVARHRGVIADHQIRVEPRHRRQPPPDRARRQPRRPVDRHHLAATITVALGGDERHHIRRRHPHRGLVDEREEHLQIERHRPDRVRPRPSPKKLEIRVHERMTDRHHQRPIGPLGLHHNRLPTHHELLTIEPARRDTTGPNDTHISCEVLEVAAAWGQRIITVVVSGLSGVVHRWVWSVGRPPAPLALRRSECLWRRWARRPTCSMCFALRPAGRVCRRLSFSITHWH